MSNKKYAITLVIILLVVSILLGINPIARDAWLLENVLAFAFIAFMVFTYRWLPFSRVSYTLMFVFLIFHEIGSHYSYSKVPYNDWFTMLAGSGPDDWFGFTRNHYDRLVHFSFGLLLAYPIRELYYRVAETKGFWGYFFPVELVMATSMLYELIEWFAAVYFGGELGAAYLGTQGDVWDAHKDMALASLGSVIAMCVTFAINYRLQRDFSQEWARSFAVKVPHPLGEDEIARMRRSKAI